MSQRPPLTLIVGMHRSGTSLLGSLLSTCGIATPGPLIAGDTHNPEGYFEHADITALQEQLLIDLDRWWPAPEGCQPLPSGWMERDVSQRALEQLKVQLDRDCESQTGPWAIKDPRSSLLLPLWKSACTALNIPLKLLLAVRDPAEVSVSLTRRDQALTGMSHWRAQRLWWHHNVSLLRDGHDLPLEVVSYSDWFEPKRACTQLERLAPNCSDETRRRVLQTIRPEHRRSLKSAHALACDSTVQSLYTRLCSIALRSSKQPIESSRLRLEQWMNHQNGPSDKPPMNLMRVKSTVKWQIKRLIGRAQPIDQQHPWHPLAVLVCGNTGTAAKHQVNHWIGNGFATNELARLQNLPTAAPSAEAWVAPPGMREVIVRLNSSEADHWGHHAWLDHCPIVADQLSLTDLSDPNAAPVALNLWDPQPGMDAAQTLLALGTLERVWDPCKQRVQLLRRLGIRASWLRPNAIGNGYLLSQQIDSTLGLPEPQALQSIGCSVLCLGNINPTFEQSLEPPLFGIPNFDALTGGINTHQIAQWLHRCLEEKLSIVRFPASPFEEKSQTWEALVKSHHPAPSVLIPKSPLGVGDILDELAWHKQKHPRPAICVTPTPETRCIFKHETRRPEVSVCVSLYNYAGTITSALKSAARQSNSHQLELIVVDDGSTDESQAVAEQWMKTNGQRFARCLLLEHTQNGGLAAARNTAFEAAKSSWCFVLDADNQLHTKAASHCGALSKSVDPRCGVIYPLIKILNEPGSQDARHLVSDRLWDPTLLAQGNYIDAMALVRVDAWKEVGGYTHIPGGWEDYDFWCKLVDADWHGVHCPQVLATYTSHMDSMRAKSTNRKERQLRRLLQQRHPWLQLITQQDAVIWPQSK